MTRKMSAGLTVFVPLYNEEAVLKENILILLEHLKSLPLPFEILLGSNGSEDRTPEIGKELEQTYSHITFFHIALRGPGLAFSQALKRAKYSFILCLDADLTTDLNFIPRAAASLEKYDAAVGSKQTGNQKRPFVRVLASELFIACTNLLLQMPYRDYSIGAKAYRIEAILPFADKIDRHTFYTQELLFQLRKAGKKIVEIPVSCSDWRKSRFNLFHEGFYRYFKLFQLWARSLKK